MRYTIRIAAVLAAALVGCQDRGESRPAHAPPLTEDQKAEQWVAVGTVDGLDWITITHVGALLKEQGIPSFSEGSIVYGVCVPPGQYEKAWGILREDSDKRHYWIALAGENRPYKEPANWTTLAVRQPAAAFMSLPAYAEGTPIGTILRDPELVEEFAKYPYIASLRTVPQEHLSDDGKLHTGYWVVVELVDGLGEKPHSSRQRFQAYWAGGKWHSCYQGGSSEG